MEHQISRPPSIVFTTRPRYIESPIENVHVIGSTVHITFTGALHESLISYGVNQTAVMTMKQIATLPHDLVAFKLLGSSDIPLSRFTQGNNFSCQNQTPDSVVLTEEGVLRIHEIKTTRSPTMVKSKYIESTTKYNRAADEMSSLYPVVMLGTAVSLTSVETNCIMSQDLANTLSSYYNYGLSLISILKEQYNIIIEESPPETINFLTEINVDFELKPDEDPLIIDNYFFERIKNFKYSEERDLEYAKATMKESLSHIQEDHDCRTTIKTNYRDENFVKKYLNNYPTTTRKDMKAVCQAPFCYPERGRFSRQDFDCLPTTSALLRSWRFASHRISERTTLIFDEEENYLELTGKRSERFDVVLPLTDNDKYELAIKGVEGKNHYSLDKKLKEEKDKLPFDIDTDLSDIENFIQSEELFELDRTVENKIDLACAATRKLQGSDSCPENDALKATRFYLCGDFLSEIMEEVNYSRLHNLKKGQMILKVFEKRRAALLIRPTKGSDKIFYSLALDPVYYCKLPMKCPEYESNGLVIYDFLSTSEHKIANLLGCGQKLIALHHLSRDAILTNDLIKPIDSKESRVHFLYSSLIFLEDKEKTAADLSQIRYAYMSLMTDEILSKEPLKILKKLSDYPRTRLLLDVHLRVIRSFLKMSKEKAKPERFFNSPEEAKTISKDSFVGLDSWITGNKIDTLECALYLSYLGHLHNKDEGDPFHANFQIFQKIIKEEMKLRDANPENMGTTSVYSTLKSHEFNLNFVVGSSLKMREKLGSSLDPSVINETMLSHLSRKSILDFATTKASSMHSSSSIFSPKCIMNRRKKCIEAVLDVINQLDMNNEDIFSNLTKMIEIVEKRNGVFATLYKKLQLTGVREIFILDLFSRIVVNFMENVARHVCGLTDSEMLTKGSEKLRRTDAHSKLVEQNCKKNETYFTVDDAADATTWCQKFVMPVFAVMFIKLLPNNLSKICCRILNLVTKKRLELPKDLLSAFCNKPNIKSMDPGMQELKDQFLGKVDRHDIINRGSTILKNRSNFMQGILHYTSSLYHACVLNHCEELYKKLFCVMFQEEKLIITDKISSDDSERTLTVIHSKDTSESKKLKLRAFCLSTCLSIKKLYNLACIEDSEQKSARGITNGVAEFNSVWRMGNTLLGVKIKFAWSSLKQPCLPRLEDRVINMANSRQNMIENGCGTNMTFLFQDLQMQMHYLLMGLRTNNTERWIRTIEMYPSHRFGLFLCEPRATCGLFGYKHAWHNLMTKEASCLEIEKKILSSKLLESHLDQGVSVGLQISFGAGKKFHTMRERMNFTEENLERELLEDPTAVFIRSRTKKELMLKFNFMSSNPSIGNSFLFDSMAKLHASSAYLLNGECFEIRDFTNGEWKKSRTTFYKIIDHITECPVSDSDLSDLIPNYSFFASVNEIISKITGPPIDSYKTAYKQITVNVPQGFSGIIVTKKTLISKFWFSQEVNEPERILLDEWRRLKIRFPWIDDNYLTTLEQSPFSTMTALLRFMMAEEKDTTKLTVITSASYGGSLLHTIEELIKNSVARGFKYPIEELESKPILKEDYQIANIDDIKTAMWLLSGCHERNKKSLITHYLSMTRALFRDLDEVEKYSPSLSNQDIRFAIAQSKIVKPEFPVIRAMQVSGAGLVGYWVIEQKKTTEGKYYGQGVYCFGDGRDKSVILSLNNDTCVISTPDLEFLRENSKAISKLIYEMKVRPGTSEQGYKKGFDQRSSKIYSYYTLNLFPIIEVPKGSIKYAIKEESVRSYYDNGCLLVESNGCVLFRIRPSLKGAMMKPIVETTGVELIDQWLAFTKVDHKQFFCYENKFITSFSSIITQNRQWFFDCIKARSKARDVMPKYRFFSQIDLPDKATEAEYKDTMSEDLESIKDFDLFGDISYGFLDSLLEGQEDLFEDIEEEEEVEEELGFEIGDMSETLGFFAEKDATDFSAQRQNPFWDDLIDYLRTNYSAVFSFITQGEIPDIRDRVVYQLIKDLKPDLDEVLS